MSPSRARGQVEPLAALVAVTAVCLALSMYAGVLDAELSGSPDSDVAAVAIERVESSLAPAGVARPSRMQRARDAGPDGYHTNVSMVADGRRWSAGPTAPPNASVETVRVAVRAAPTDVRTGRLRVVVWP